MAELNRQDIISDEALEAPKILAKNLEEAYAVIQKIAKAGKEVPLFPPGAGDNVKTQREETKKLSQEQKELAKVSQQLAIIQARNNEEYIKEAAALNASKKALKEKTELGDREAKSVTAQNASVQVLTAALAKNRKEYKALATEEQRLSKEGQELHKIIVQQDKDVKRLNASIGDHRDNVGNYSGALKDMKLQLKGAHDEMVGIAQALGTSSPEFIAAAEKAGALKNEIGDIEGAINSLSGSKLENVSNSFGLMGQKLRGLDFKGANAAAMQLAATLKGMTFKEATAGARAFGATMTKEGLKLLKNPYVLAAAAVVALGAAMMKLKDDSPGLSKALDSMTGPLKAVTDWMKRLLDATGLTTFALNEQAEATVNASKKQIEIIEKAANREIAIEAAKGNKTTDLEIKKQEDMLAEAQKGYKAILDNTILYNRKMNEQEEKDFADFVDIIADAYNKIDVIVEEARTQERKDAAALNDYLLSQQIKTQQEVLNNTKANVDDRINASIELEELLKQQARNERDAAVADVNATESAKQMARKKYENERREIEKQGAADRLKITNEFTDDYIKKIKEQVEKEKAIILKEAERKTHAIDADIEATKKAAIARGISVEDAEKIVLEKRKRYADDYIQVQIDAQKKILNIENLSAEEQIEVNKKLTKLKSDLTDAYYNQLDKGQQDNLDATLKFVQQVAAIYTDFSNAIGGVFQALNERRLQELDEQSEANDKALRKQLESEDAALQHRLDNEKLSDKQKEQIEGASEERKIALEKAAELREQNLETRRRLLIRRQAIFDKSIALSQAIINGAAAVIKGLKDGGPVAAAFYGILAAAQVATIIARPIPAAEKGIKGHEGGPIIAGEKGQELVKMPGNRYALTDSVARVYDFPRGTDIIPHEQTMKMLANDSVLRLSDRRAMEGEGLGRLEKKLDKINATIKYKREFHLSGQVTGYQDGGTRAKYIDALRNRPK